MHTKEDKESTDCLLQKDPSNRKATASPVDEFNFPKKWGRRKGQLLGPEAEAEAAAEAEAEAKAKAVPEAQCWRDF